MTCILSRVHDEEDKGLTHGERNRMNELRVSEARKEASPGAAREGAEGNINTRAR